MGLKRYILILLGLLLCITVFSTQADTADYALECDVSSLEGGVKVQDLNDNSPNEIAILTTTYSLQPSPFFFKLDLADSVYRQPSFLPLLRPPIV